MTEDTSTTPAAPALPSAAKLRQFATDAGIPVGTRGLVAKSVSDAFLKSGKRVQKKYLG